MLLWKVSGLVQDGAGRESLLPLSAINTQAERGRRRFRRPGRRLSAACLGSVAGAMLCSSLRAQPVMERITIRNVDINHVLTPDFKDSSKYVSGGYRRQRWLQILVEYEAEQGRGEWLDQVTFDWSVAMVPEGRKPLLMHRSVTYLDVREGRHHAVMYLRPGLIQRYYGEDKVDNGDLYVRILSRVAGGRSGGYHYGRRRRDVPDNWWEGGPPAVIVKDGELLNRNETPFGHLDYDFFEHLAPSNR